jgi:hypothetical protein
VTWAEDAVDSLVLEDGTKKLLVGLVQQHRSSNNKSSVSDMIPQKGKVDIPPRFSTSKHVLTPVNPGTRCCAARSARRGQDPDGRGNSRVHTQAAVSHKPG